MKGVRVFSLDWQTPDDLRAVKNAYDYLTELRQYGRAATTKLLSENIDYQALWRAAEDLLGYVELQERVGVRAPGGMRMRARWRLREE